ncbi:GTP diphosphokinase, partial [Pseudoalteromonas ruthenica]
MVATRQSHQSGLPADFHARLALLNLAQEKRDRLDQVYALCPQDDSTTTLAKAIEMVEILAELNFDSESLAGAFLTP